MEAFLQPLVDEILHAYEPKGDEHIKQDTETAYMALARFQIAESCHMVFDRDFIAARVEAECERGRRIWVTSQVVSRSGFVDPEFDLLKDYLPPEAFLDRESFLIARTRMEVYNIINRIHGGEYSRVNNFVFELRQRFGKCFSVEQAESVIIERRGL